MDGNGRISRSRRRGAALLAATLFIAVAVLVLAALALRVVNTSNQVSQHTRSKDCFQGIESAISQALAEIDLDEDGNIGLGSWTMPSLSSVSDPSDLDSWLPDFDSPGVSPLSVPNMPQVQYMAVAVDWSNDGIDDNGNGQIDEAGETGYRTVYALARYNDGSSGGDNHRYIERRAEVVIRGIDVNVWRNAIFAGSGQAGGLVNGNVSIHGSVHLLGTGLLEGDDAIAALDMSGTSLIHNNYTGLAADLRSRIPDLPRRDFNGENIETLNASLRVRNGLVELSGTSEVGQVDVAGNPTKETMDGTYVNDGWGGNSTIDDGDRGDPTSVYSDNGWDELYDLGSRVPMPLLSHDWRDPGTGDTRVDETLGRNYTHAEYFHSALTGTPYPGNLTINAGVNFYYNATRPTDANPVNRQPSDDYIYFNSSTNVLEVNGQIEINGDLQITRGAGSDKTIHYIGRAAWLVNGSVLLNTDLLTANPNGTTVLSYPVNSCLGVMAAGNMTIGTLSQLTLMGAYYAQGRISCSKQTTILGTFVSNYFDMGMNVPDIYQVPSLAENLPLGMIGAYPILMVEQVSWREIGA